MDSQINIGFFSYATAFVAFAILSALFISSWRGSKFGTSFILASLASTVWAILSGFQALSSNVETWILQLAELFRDSSWCLLLLSILGAKIATENRYTQQLRVVRFVLLVLLIAIAIVILFTRFNLLPIPSFEVQLSNILLIIWISLSVFCLLLVEQIFRNSNTSERWGIKYLCLGLGLIFAYDFYLFADASLFKRLDIDLWSTRGIINGMAVPLIAISVARNPSWSIGIHVSRHIVFHSVTLIGAGIYLLFMAASGYFIRIYGGNWGSVLQISFLFAAGLFLVILLFSDKIRAQTRVFLNKHFFSFKYDYRQEWQRFTNALSTGNTNVPGRTLEAISSLVQSPGGLLFTRQTNNQFLCIANHNMEFRRTKTIEPTDSLIRYLENTNWIVDICEFESDPNIYENLKFPEWLIEHKDIWLIVPLIFRDEAFGFVILRQSNIVKSLNWEDRDLLKMAGLQAAILLAQYQSDQLLMQAKQFEAFNRLSAYIIHDLKNILAQQSLLLSNAEKHKHKPEFVNDMIRTIQSSVGRMSRLMAQMKSGIRGSSTEILNINSILAVTSKMHTKLNPAPEYQYTGSDTLLVQADEEQLINVFGHIIQNAQDATPKDGKIIIYLTKSSNQALIRISDTGAGMSKDFIDNRLFKPFDSTKGLTGMGIGAYESREYIKSIGGDITVESTTGIGSVFTISIPLANI